MLCEEKKTNFLINEWNHLGVIANVICDAGHEETLQLFGY